jgi:hypothetical protein
VRVEGGVPVGKGVMVTDFVAGLVGVLVAVLCGDLLTLGVLVTVAVGLVLAVGVIEVEEVGDGSIYILQHSLRDAPQLLSFRPFNPYATTSAQSSIPPELLGSPPAHIELQAEFEYALLVPSDHPQVPSVTISL